MDDPANMTETEEELTDSKKLAILLANTDAFFLIIMGVVVFFMQGGFAFLEAGSVRSKNTVNILIKNMLDALIGGVAYWAVGWGLAYGPNGNKFCGGSNFFSYGMEYSDYPSWFFQFVFAATAATIVSGAIAERCQFSAYFVYSCIITGWVYPPVSHWAWDGTGWLAEIGYKDFAGSGVVHLLGGVCALVACAFMEPRKGRFTREGKPIDMPGHSVPLAGLGGFILLFGFLAFNGGSQLAVSNKGDTDAIALAIVNTILGACGGGLTVLFANKFLFGAAWSYLMTLNGTLTGMVAQCSGCNVYPPWAALIVGCFGGAAFLVGHFAMLKLKLDDPLDAVAVHGCGGITGLLCVPFFAYGEGIFWLGHTTAPWHTLGVNIAGAVAISAWCAFWCTLIFGGMRLSGFLRIDRETEFRGNDLVKHGESAYPAEAWVEQQYNRKKSSVSGGNLNTVASDPEGALPGNMSGTGEHRNEEYNNAFKMMPATGRLFRGVSKNFMGFSGESGSEAKDNKDVEEGIDNKTFQ